MRVSLSIFAFCYALSAHAGPDLLTPEQKNRMLGDGPMCTDFKTDQFQGKVKQELQFLHEQQEMHRHFPDTNAIRVKDESYLHDLQMVRARVCREQLGEANRLIDNSKSELGEVKSNNCESYKQALNYLYQTHESLVAIDKELWSSFERLIDLDSNLLQEHKGVLRTISAKSPEAFPGAPNAFRDPLLTEMQQVYFHAAGTVSRPILQGLAYEAQRIHSAGEDIEDQGYKLIQREKKCVTESMPEPAKKLPKDYLPGVDKPDDIAPRPRARRDDSIDILNPRPRGRTDNSLFAPYENKRSNGGVPKLVPIAPSAPRPPGRNDLGYGFNVGGGRSRRPGEGLGRGITAEDNYFHDPEVKQKKNSVQLQKYVKIKLGK